MESPNGRRRKGIPPSLSVDQHPASPSLRKVTKRVPSSLGSTTPAGRVITKAEREERRSSQWSNTSVESGDQEGPSIEDANEWNNLLDKIVTTKTYKSLDEQTGLVDVRPDRILPGPDGQRVYNLRALILRVIYFLIVFGSSWSLLSHLHSMLRVSACAPNTIYVPYTETVTETATDTSTVTVYSPPSTFDAASVDSSPTSMTKTLHVTSTSTTTNTVTVTRTDKLSTSNAVYYFQVKSGSTSWLDGASPDSGASLTTATALIPVVPVSTLSKGTTTVTVYSTATDMATLVFETSTSIKYSYVRPESTTTSTRTHFTTVSLEHSSRPHVLPSPAAYGTAGWNTTKALARPSAPTTSEAVEDHDTTVTQVYYWGIGNSTVSTSTRYIHTTIHITRTSTLEDPTTSFSFVEASPTITSSSVSMLSQAEVSSSSQVYSHTIMSTKSLGLSWSHPLSPGFYSLASATLSPKYPNTTTINHVSVASISAGHNSSSVAPEAVSLTLPTSAFTNATSSELHSTSRPSWNSTTTQVSPVSAVTGYATEPSIIYPASLSNSSSAKTSFTINATSAGVSAASVSTTRTLPASSVTSWSNTTSIVTYGSTVSAAGLPSNASSLGQMTTSSTHSSYAVPTGSASSFMVVTSRLSSDNLSLATSHASSSSMLNISVASISASSPPMSLTALMSSSSIVTTTSPIIKISSTLYLNTTSQTRSASTTVPKSTLASEYSIQAASAAPSSCGESDDFVLSFDNLPNFIPTKANSTDITQAPPVPNPYNHLSFSDGYVYAPSPDEPFTPHSQPHLAVFLANGAGMSASPMKRGEIADGPYESLSEFWFDANSAWLGCSNSGNHTCTMMFTGYSWSAAANAEVKTHEHNATLSSCTMRSGCALQEIHFPSTFKQLSGLRMQAYVDHQETMFFADDISLTWSNNTCAAGLARLQFQ